jgi:hypothetical protein
MGLLIKAYNYFVDLLSQPLNAAADRQGIKGGGARNAFTHALQSAQESYHGVPRSITSTLAFLKEEFQFHLSGNDPRDYFKDQWANDIGDDIGRWAKRSGFPPSSLLNLVKYALDSGQLISDEKADPRVPLPSTTPMALCATRRSQR